MDTTEIIIAVSAIFISVISLISSIVFNKKAQQHNIKSVLPIPYFDRTDFEEHIHIKIYNKGTGPLIAKELKFILENGQTGYIIDLIPKPPAGFFFSNFSKFTENQTRTIPPGESNDLIVIDFNNNEISHIEYREKLREFLKDLKIYLDYSDIYDSKFERYVVDCSWYGRYFEKSRIEHHT